MQVRAFDEEQIMTCRRQCGLSCVRKGKGKNFICAKKKHLYAGVSLEFKTSEAIPWEYRDKRQHLFAPGATTVYIRSHTVDVRTDMVELLPFSFSTDRRIHD